VYNIPKQSESEVQVGDTYHYHRLANEAGIDLMVAALVQKLEDHKILDKTYILYTSDNGFHIGNHRLNPGKRCGYETDINIPLLIRGPGVPKNVTTSITNSHTDMAPTVLSMLGLPLRKDFDGQPIAYTASDLSSSTKNEYVNVEFWNAKEDQEDTRQDNYYNNTYKSLRLQTAGESFYYSVWCDGEHEFYDMNVSSPPFCDLISFH
jgi:arylsulfatase A-like enzyme